MFLISEVSYRYMLINFSWLNFKNDKVTRLIRGLTTLLVNKVKSPLTWLGNRFCFCALNKVELCTVWSSYAEQFNYKSHMPE